MDVQSPSKVVRGRMLSTEYQLPSWSRRYCWDGVLHVSSCMGYIFVLELVGWGFEHLYHSHCKHSLYTALLTSNSDACQNIKFLATLCTDVSKSRLLGLTGGLIPPLVRQFRFTKTKNGGPSDEEVTNRGGGVRASRDCANTAE